MPVNDDLKEIKKLKSKVKHLQNELALTKEENDTAVLKFYDLYKNMGKLVEERTKKLKNAMSTIYKYNHRLEEMLEERTKDLITSERHAAFSLLSQGIVHNLKNPLSIISGAQELLKFTKPKLDNTKLPDPFIKYLHQIDSHLDKIETGTKRMLGMIDSLMAKSKSDKSEKIETVNINELLKKEIDFLNAE